MWLSLFTQFHIVKIKHSSKTISSKLRIVFFWRFQLFTRAKKKTFLLCDSMNYLYTKSWTITIYSKSLPTETIIDADRSIVLGGYGYKRVYMLRIRFLQLNVLTRSERCHLETALLMDQEWGWRWCSLWRGGAGFVYMASCFW